VRILNCGWIISAGNTPPCSSNRTLSPKTTTCLVPLSSRKRSTTTWTWLNRCSPPTRQSAQTTSCNWSRTTPRRMGPSRPSVSAWSAILMSEKVRLLIGWYLIRFILRTFLVFIFYLQMVFILVWKRPNQLEFLAYLDILNICKKLF